MMVETKIVRTRDEVVRGEVEIIHGGGKASTPMLIHDGFTVTVEPR
jgi:hypothetical protein